MMAKRKLIEFYKQLNYTYLCYKNTFLKMHYKHRITILWRIFHIPFVFNKIGKLHHSHAYSNKVVERILTSFEKIRVKIGIFFVSKSTTSVYTTQNVSNEAKIRSKICSW